LEECEVQVFDEDGCLNIRTSLNIKANVEWPVPVEARTKDEDGMPVEVMLFAPDGFLGELEFNRADGGAPINLPPPAEWEIRANCPDVRPN
jgi:hypothetical protein